MASDAQITQSKMYWSSASPISIVEVAARHLHNTAGSPEVNHTTIYLRIKNNGQYRISITKIFGGGNSISSVNTGGWGPISSISERVILSPGGEFIFGYSGHFPGVPELGSGNRNFFFFCTDSCWSEGLSTFNRNTTGSYCSRTAPYGSLIVDGFGFEYVQYIENTQITKRQMGVKPLVVKCMNNYD